MNSNGRLAAAGLAGALVLAIICGKRAVSFQEAPSKSAALAGQGSAGSERFTSANAANTASLRSDAIQKYGKLPMSFEPNSGQTAPQVKFLSRGANYTVFLTNREAVLTLRKDEPSMDRRPNANPAKFDPSHPAKTSTVRMSLVNSNPNPKVSGADELPGKSNYMIGKDPAKWRSHVANYAKVKYEGVYPGVDMLYYGDQKQLEYDFVVAPGANPAAIALNLKEDASQSAAKITGNGDLVIPAQTGELTFHKPIVYQAAAGGSKEFIDAKFILRAGNNVGFKVAPYDHSRALVIDPLTYLGGSGNDNATGIAIGSEGIYVTGATTSSNFPEAPSRTTSTTYTDAFVALLSPDLSTVLEATYYGGSLADTAEAIVVSSAGVYVAGYTYSSDLPGTLGSAFPDHDGGDIEGFVVLFTPNLKSIVQATYYGGAGDDLIMAMCLATDENGVSNIYVAGMTTSGFLAYAKGGAQPAPKTPIQGNISSQDSAFAVKFSSDLKSVDQATFLGGSQNNQGYAIAAGSDGTIYVAGTTASPDFPSTPNSYQPALYTGLPQGRGDGFITRFNPALTEIIDSTYLGGGGGVAVIHGLATTTYGIYAVGQTTAPQFPYVGGSAQSAPGSTQQGFVSLLTLDLVAMARSSYIGGNNVNIAQAVAVSGYNVYVSGYTTSTNFPATAGGVQSSPSGVASGFLAQISLTLGAYGTNTYLAGGTNGTAAALVVTSARSLNGAINDHVYVAGYVAPGCCQIVGPLAPARSPSTPAVVVGGGLLNRSNPSDAFVTMVSFPEVKCILCGPGGPIAPVAATAAEEQ
jgi:hypothetical protein